MLLLFMMMFGLECLYQLQVCQFIAKNLLAMTSVPLPRAFDSAQAPAYDLITGLEISPFQAALLRYAALQSK
jgi:hypothetical protein